MRNTAKLGVLTCLVALLGADPSSAQHGHDGHRMNVDADGMTMNANPDRLPRDCEAVGEEFEFRVQAGSQHATDFPGAAFGYSQREFVVTPCSRIRFTLVNDDAVRHQLMIHGLPRYLYPGGMFHLEANGGTERSGQLIVPGDAATYLVHCDLAQHMEKGMKAQLKVDAGSGNLAAVPGVSDALLRADYGSRHSWWVPLLVFLLAWAVSGLVIRKTTGREA